VPGSTSTSARHPEYATPECDSIYDLVVHDKAGERILEQLLASAEQRLREEGIRGVIYLFKNNTDSAGNSYGCHENYLTSRRDDFATTPRCSSRSWSAARSTPAPARCCRRPGARCTASASGPSTSGRACPAPPPDPGPIINTADEPHADAERYRRLHVIVGDSNMSEYATFLKVGRHSILLRMLEEPSVVLRDMTLENPIRAIREISHDITCRRRVRLANGARPAPSRSSAST
jgi:proteasome accessory factor A